MPETKQGTSQATENAGRSWENQENQEQQWTLELAQLQLDPWNGWEAVLERRQKAEAD